MEGGGRGSPGTARSPPPASASSTADTSSAVAIERTVARARDAIPPHRPLLVRSGFLGLVYGGGRREPGLSLVRLKDQLFRGEQQPQGNEGTGLRIFPRVLKRRP